MSPLFTAEKIAEAAPVASLLEPFILAVDTHPSFLKNNMIGLKWPEALRRLHFSYRKTQLLRAAVL